MKIIQEVISVVIVVIICFWIYTKLKRQSFKDTIDEIKDLISYGK